MTVDGARPHIARRSRRDRRDRLALTALTALTALLAAGCGDVSMSSSGATAAPASASHTTSHATSATTAPQTSANRAPTVTAATARVTLSVPAANRQGTFQVPQSVTLPRGWKAEVWAIVPGARLETWTPEGDLLVSEPGSGKVVELVPGASPSAPPTQRTVVSGMENPQGMAFDELGGQEILYVAGSSEVDRFVWSHGQATLRTVFAGGLPDGGAHPMKNVVVAADHTVYFDIGSSSNASPEAPSSTPRASVLAYRPNGQRIRVFATGVRNGDGLSFAPDGTLWTAVNMRDDIAYPFHRAYGPGGDAYGKVTPAYVANHPTDEIARLSPGRNLGWPYCDPDPDVHLGVAGTAMNYGNLPFDNDAQTNSGGRALDCAKLAHINRGIPAHSAPLGFHFLKGSKLAAPWRNGAVVAVHGSWDRTPPRPPAVLWMPWQSKGRTLGPARTLVGGFQHSDGSRWGRAVDAVPGPDGALYVSDDTAGAVYRIVPAG
jgi:glucose/arabinose dehydrogenase